MIKIEKKNGEIILTMTESKLPPIERLIFEIQEIRGGDDKTVARFCVRDLLVLAGYTV